MSLLAIDLGAEVEGFLKNYLVQTLLGLYIVINPSGVSSVFLSLTKNATNAERIGIALRAAIAGFIFLAAFAIAGNYIFKALRITSGAFQIAGGIIIFGLASAMARGKESEFFGHVEAHDEPKARRSVAYTPLAVPLIAGPGSITMVMTLAAQAPQAEGTIGLPILLGALAIVVALTFFSMFRVLKLTERFGPGVALIMPRIMGIVLAVLAVQFFVQGVILVLPDLAHAWQKGLHSAGGFLPG